MFIILMLVLFGVGMLVQSRLKGKFKEYGQIALPNGLTGRDVAERMLKDNGIYDVQIISAPGFMSDHYNPANKTVNLSPDIYNGQSITAAAVAAHECGHAVQHATAYRWLTLRSMMVPAVQASSNIVMWILLAGVLTLRIFPQLLLIGIGLFALTTIFSVITLPVEFDASKRALAWLDKSRIMSSVDHAKAQDALWWAAMTYVVAALSSITTLLYYVMIFMGGRRN